MKALTSLAGVDATLSHDDELQKVVEQFSLNCSTITLQTFSA